jgi:hypothetical protein
MTKSFVLISLLLVGCGRSGINSNVGPNDIDPAFQPMYEQFIADANKAGIPLQDGQSTTIKFFDSSQMDNLGEVIGECDDIGWGGSNILIDSDFWKLSPPAIQQILLYHELGHCILDEIHVTNPMAIMNALINNPEEYYTSTIDMEIMVSGLFQEVGDGG